MSTEQKMNPEIKEQWVAALRSGEYEQGQGALCNNGKRCCLGVLEDLHAKADGPQGLASAQGAVFYPDVMDVGEGVRAFFQGSITTQATADWAGLPHKVPMVNVVGNPLGHGSWGLAALNDEGYTFAQIADLIEEQL